jgi:AraC-like DNA-binding protein
MEKKLLEIRHYITEDPDIHECSLENLARRFHLNSNTLRVNFRNRFNVTLHQFVLDQCMQKARILILQRGDSVTSIAHTLGYTDKSNFAKAFRQYFGVLPTEMRKRQE